MNKLNIFSEKLGKPLEISFGENGILLTPEGVPTTENGIILAWNNSFEHWVDKGWNNSFDGWQDKGWNNSFNGWIDKGWSNSSGRWSDKGWSNSYGNWGNAGGGGGGCFITTACVEHQGLPDDCIELQTLRKYRDILIKNDDEFRSKVLEYYRKAPLIIQAIEKTDNKVDIYDNLYHKMIQPCVSFLINGKTNEAKSLYLDYYNYLSKRFLEN